MRSLQKAYSRFGQMVCEEECYRQPGLTFKDICAQLRVPEDGLNEIIFKEMGMNGQEILYSFQKLLNL